MLISGPMRKALISYTVLFIACLSIAVAYYLDQGHKDPNEFDFNAESRWRPTAIANDFFVLFCCMTWLYVLFKLKRIEIQMNPAFTSVEQVENELEYSALLGKITIAIYFIMQMILNLHDYADIFHHEQIF